MDKKPIDYQYLNSVFSFVIYKNFTINAIITWLINAILLSATIGFISIFTDVLYANIPSYLFFVALFCLFDYIISLLLYRFLPKVVFYSGGGILIVMGMLLLVLSGTIVPGFEFAGNYWLIMLAVMTIVFLTRWGVSSYLKKHLNQ